MPVCVRKRRGAQASIGVGVKAGMIVGVIPIMTPGFEVIIGKVRIKVVRGIIAWAIRAIIREDKLWRRISLFGLVIVWGHGLLVLI